MSELSKNKIKWIKSLQLKKHRDLENLYIVEGEKMVLEALSYAKDSIELLLYTASFDFDNEEIPSQLISEKELSMISTLKTPNKALAVLKKSRINSSYNDTLTIALDDIQDPGNMGTIMRIADWYGIKNIVCSIGTVDCFNPKVIQASMGAIYRINIQYVDLNKWLSRYKSEVYGALLEGENIYSKEKIVHGVLLLGNEGRGISSENRQYITQAISIPKFGLAESLNVAVASGILVSEFKRRMA